MKILVLSDTHGKIDECNHVLKKVDKIDLIIHLGDYSSDVVNVKKIFKLDIINVRGNCDHLDKKTKDEIIVTLEGKKLFLTHGHIYRVKMNLDRIFYRAKELQVDIALFGHIHVPVSLTYEDILLFNPGSISMPRKRSKKSFGIIELKQNSIESAIYTID